MLDNLKFFLREFKHKYIYERPSKSFRNRLLSKLTTDEKSKIKNHYKILNEEGILIIPEYFKKLLPHLNSEFENLVSNYSISRGKTKYDDGKVDIGHYSISNSGLMEANLLASAAIDAYLTRLVSYYWGKPIYLAQAGGTRLEPRDIDYDYRSMQWHHDSKHRQIKIFILLTDVAENQQCTHYISGSHKSWKSSRKESRMSEQFIHQKYQRTSYAVGKAGSVIILDTNGYHRGNRNNSARRDLMVFNYTAGKNIFPINFPKHLLQNLNYFWLNKDNLSAK